MVDSAELPDERKHDGERTNGDAKAAKVREGCGSTSNEREYQPQVGRPGTLKKSKRALTFLEPGVRRLAHAFYM